MSLILWIIYGYIVYKIGYKYGREIKVIKDE